MRPFIALAAVAALSACAQEPSKIAPAYISPTAYYSLTCEQIVSEMAQITSKRDALYARIERRNKSDKIVTGVGVLVAWPALFFIKGNGKVRHQYASLLGQQQALTDNYKAKGCQATPAVPAATL